MVSARSSLSLLGIILFIQCVSLPSNAGTTDDVLNAIDLAAQIRDQQQQREDNDRWRREAEERERQQRERDRQQQEQRRQWQDQQRQQSDKAYRHREQQ